MALSASQVSTATSSLSEDVPRGFADCDSVSPLDRLQLSSEKEAGKYWSIQDQDLLALLSSIELADGFAILDTYSVSGGGNMPIDALEHLSSGQAFLKPCLPAKRCVTPTEDEFVWEFPVWLTLPALEPTLAGLLAGIVERTIWLAYALFSFSGPEKIQAFPLMCFKELETALGAWKSAGAKQRSELVSLLKESQTDSDGLLSRLFFLPIRDLGQRKVYRAFVETLLAKPPSETELSTKKKPEEKSEPKLPATVPTTVVTKPMIKQSEFFALEDDLINTSVSTQLSAKSKCGSRRASIDEQSLVGRDLARFGTLFGEANLLFWLYTDEDTELTAVKATNKMAGNVIDRLGEEGQTTESEADFFWDLEREESKAGAKDPIGEISDFGKELSGDIIKTFWNTSRKSNGQLHMFAKEEMKASDAAERLCGKDQSKPAQTLLKGDQQTLDKMAKKLKQSEFTATAEEQKVTSDQDLHSVWTQHKMQAKQRYDYLKMPTKTWPSRPTISNFSISTPFPVSEVSDKSADRKVEETNSKPQAITQTGVTEVADFHRSLTVQVAAAVAKVEREQASLEPYRNRLVGAVERAIQKYFGGRKIELEVYGSTRNGLAIERSDIDLRIVGLNVEGGEDLRTQIKGLEKSLRTEKYIKSTTAILTAKVPVMKLVSPENAMC